MAKFPKVLIISIDPFNRSNGTGITLSNLFDGWDKNSLAQIYMSDIVPTNNICEMYYKLEPQVAFYDYWFRKLLSPFNKSQKEISISPAAITLNASNKSFKNKIHLNFRAIADFSPLFLPLELFTWIERFNPDLIYCALGSARMINLTNEIASRVGKPIVPHFMDDWISTIYTQNELGGLARKMVIREFNKILFNSNGGLCISEQMAVEYNKRYKLPFSPFVNCVDDSLFCLPVTIKNEEFTMIYVGGLHLNRWQSIIDISQAVEQLKMMGNNIVLKIYCPLNDISLYKKHFSDFPSTKFEGSLTSDQVPDVLRTASMLVHIESFEKNYVEYTKFSLSTKIPQYMAAGKPILGYGPSLLASIKHILKANAGKVVSKRDINDLVNIIYESVQNKEGLLQHAINGFNYAKQYHSKSHNAEQLKSILTIYSKLS